MRLPCILFCATALVCFSATWAALGGTFILDVNTDLAAYSVGNPVTLYADLTNSSPSPSMASLMFRSLIWVMSAQISQRKPS